MLKSSFADKVYDCFDRSDELQTEKLWLHSDSVEEATAVGGEQSIDFERFGLQQCTNSDNGEEGLSCKDHIKGDTPCIPFAYWCKNLRTHNDIATENPYDGKCAAINDYVLCGNSTFWSKISRFNSSCDFACSGFYPGQCIPKSNKCDYDTQLHGFLDKDNCLDKSDEVCHDPKKCKDFGYTFCLDDSQCVHPKLWCDGYYNCDDLSDEDPTVCQTSDCNSNPSASFSCHHRYTNVTICASLCNNLVECFDGRDERNCDTDSPYYLVMLFLFLIFASAISVLWNKCLAKQLAKKVSKSSKDGKTFQGKSLVSIIEIFRSEKITNTQERKLRQLLKKLHKSKNYSLNLKFLANFCKTAFFDDKGQKCLKYLYDFELSFHNRNWIECEECFKKNIGTNYVCQYVMDAKYPGFFETYLIPRPVKSFLHNVTTSIYWFKVTKILKIQFYYIDLGKDMLILYAICDSVNLSALSLESFSVQIVLLYFLSIIVPLLMNWLYVAFFHLEEVCGCFGQMLSVKKRILAQTLTFLLSPFLPGLIIYQKECKSERIQKYTNKLVEGIDKCNENIVDTLLDFGRKMEEAQEQKLKLKRMLANIAKCELLEVIFQTILAICLLSMNKWSISLTASELQGFFDEDPKWIYFIGFSFVKKILSCILRVKSAGKNNFSPLLGLVIYSVFAFISIFARILSIIAYFSVPLGLFNFLTHCVYENMNKNQGLTWREFDENQEPVKFSTFNENEDRYEFVEIRNISSMLLTNSSYTKYTGMTLQMYYILFIVGTILHLSIVTILDIILQKRFRKCNYVNRLIKQAKNRVNSNKKIMKSLKELEHWNWFVPIIHSLASFGYPETSRDWDDIEEDYTTLKAKQILKVCKINPVH